eukprot:6210023-Amphidinium_carterae.1
MHRPKEMRVQYATATRISCLGVNSDVCLMTIASIRDPHVWLQSSCFGAHSLFTAPHKLVLKESKASSAAGRKLVATGSSASAPSPKVQKQ